MGEFEDTYKKIKKYLWKYRRNVYFEDLLNHVAMEYYLNPKKNWDYLIVDFFRINGMGDSSHHKSGGKALFFSDQYIEDSKHDISNDLIGTIETSDILTIIFQEIGLNERIIEWALRNCKRPKITH